MLLPQLYTWDSTSGSIYAKVWAKVLPQLPSDDMLIIVVEVGWISSFAQKQTTQPRFGIETVVVI